MKNTSKPHVLIVDDTPDNIHILFGVLKDDYAIQTANNGGKALRMVGGKVPPDIILLDVMMPGLSGYDVCKRLKADEQTQDIPIIFITALAQDKDEAEGLALGAVDYITKPFNPELVKARLRNHLALHQARLAIEKQNAKLHRGNMELKRLNEQHHEFLGVAVHDLKNPLTAISGIAQLLDMIEDSGSAAPEKKKRLLHQIQTSSSHMLKIINDLLASEQIDSGYLALERTVDDLSILARHVCELNQTNADKKKIQLAVQLDSPCLASVDQQKIREVLDNLVSNAIKFSPPEKRVFISTSVTDDQVILTVRDEGPGFTEEDKEQLFGRFQKLSARPTAGEPSSGLGLSIVKRLVELHDGTISVESTPGQGATFTIVLPTSIG